MTECYNPVYTSEDITQAWHEVFRLSSSEWVKIPTHLAKILNLDPRLGIMGGMIITRESANGLNAFLARLNAIGNKN